MSITLTNLALLISGGALLYFGAEWLVNASSRLALAFGITPMVIGLTIVAYGTSAPELIVTLIAAASGHSDIAVGNVIGSNIANLGLIFGATTLIHSITVKDGLIKRELPILLAATLLVPAMLLNNIISRLEGAALVLSAILYTYFILSSRPKQGLSARDALDLSVDIPGQPTKQTIIIPSLFVALGITLLFLGGKLFVMGASNLAVQFGIDERIIGLTVVAVGTSLPELITSIIAAIRGHTDMAIGNIIGSNIFNILLVLGSAAMITPIRQSNGIAHIDVWVMIALTLYTIFILRKNRELKRVEGAVLVISYIAFLVALSA